MGDLREPGPAWRVDHVLPLVIIYGLCPMPVLSGMRWLADLVLRAGGVRTGGPAGQRGPGQEPARPTQDKLDVMWLARLTEMGLLRASFVPPKAIRTGEPDAVTYLEPGTRRRNTSFTPGSLTPGAPSRARGR